MSAEGACANCMEDSDDLTCPRCVTDAVESARETERDACAALVLSVDPTNGALRVIAARIRKRGLK